MNISNYSVISGNDTPYGRSGRIPADAQGRARARAEPYAGEAEQQRRQSAPAQVIDAVPETRAIVPVNDLASAQRRADLYQADDLSRYTITQRKALQTYTANQGLSMLDANADYLGAIDLYA